MYLCTVAELAQDWSLGKMLVHLKHSSFIPSKSLLKHTFLLYNYKDLHRGSPGSCAPRLAGPWLHHCTFMHDITTSVHMTVWDSKYAKLRTSRKSHGSLVGVHDIVQTARIQNATPQRKTFRNSVLEDSNHTKPCTRALLSLKRTQTYTHTHATCPHS
jgi:hypothetical protein